MFADFLASGDFLVLPILGMGLFISVFGGVLVYVALGLKRGAVLDRVASLPLEKDEEIVECATPGDVAHRGGEVA